MIPQTENPQPLVSHVDAGHDPPRAELLTPPKAGVLTSEFYVTLATLVVAVLIACGHVEPGEQETMVSLVTDALTALGALASAAAVVARYINGRIALKLEAGGRGPQPLEQRWPRG